ncbi:S-layer homology domain-containing protein [Paenibacillus sp. 1001270B_150601_E10]|uniref:S-layer homology domain-containing protein n=1 Tax=Paenibacillus sp. 1001270B_150601_E10 TaxID=2787079 RepID=UPI00189F8626|nr:S-layer homology domain-containing protein [Paenibacillus sp. 1001270B_150601_E10]
MNKLDVLFKDIDGWYREELQVVYEKEIAEGFSQTQFRPKDNITREQSIIILLNTATKYFGQLDWKQRDMSLTDVGHISGWAKASVS